LSVITERTPKTTNAVPPSEDLEDIDVGWMINSEAPKKEMMYLA